MDAKSVGGVPVTPTLVAELFWGLGSDEMAEFFAELNRIAGHKLALQLSWVVRDIAERSARGDYEPMLGLNYFSDEAKAYPESAAFFRASDAKRDLTKAAELAKDGES